MNQEAVRLQKYLAMSGLGSRRRCEELIAAGEVRVAGRGRVELGMKVVPGVDKVFYRGAAVRPAATATLLFHKPRGWSCAPDPLRPGHAIQDLAPELAPYAVGVGLEREVAGLVLLTNDGALHQAITRRLRYLERVFEVRLKQKLDPKEMRTLERGLLLENQRAALDGIKYLRDDEEARPWYEARLRGEREGLLRRLFLTLGHPVQRAFQVAVAGISDPQLKRSCIRELTPVETLHLRREIGMKEKP